MTKSEKILKHYNTWRRGKLSIEKVAKNTKTTKKYVSQVLNSRLRRINYEKQLKSKKREEETIIDSPKFWNPEDEIKN